MEENLVGMIAQLSGGVEVLVYYGSWCSDSRREVPRFLRIMEKGGFPGCRIRFYAVDRTKKSPDGLTEKYAIEKVPTFLFFRDGKEMDVTYRLPKYDYADGLVPHATYDKQPEYLVVGGLVFQPLTDSYLQSWGNEWKRRSPCCRPPWSPDCSSRWSGRVRPRESARVPRTRRRAGESRLAGGAPARRASTAAGRGRPAEEREEEPGGFAVSVTRQDD